MVFIHVPKIGGMSVTAWLLNNLDGPLILGAPESGKAHALKTLEFDDIGPRLKYLPGARHGKPEQVFYFCKQWEIALPKQGFALIRPAYDLVRSYFQYLQRPNVAARMSAFKAFENDVMLARKGQFRKFAWQCRIVGRKPSRLLDFYRSDFNNFNLDVVPLEYSSAYLNARFSGHNNCGRLSLPRRNASKSKMDFDEQAAKIIAKRFSAYQNVYDRAVQNWPELMKKLAHEKKLAEEF